MSEEILKFSDDPEENFRMENDFLKMKIAAQFGGDIGAMEGLPPEIENQFLKNILLFEDYTANKLPEIKKVKELIGNPKFIPAASLENAAITNALKDVWELYQKHGYNVDFISDYSDLIKYDFMTNELPEHEIDISFMIPGMTCNFIFEAFHPNHGYDLEQQTLKFIEAWFTHDAAAFEYILANKIILDSEHLLERGEVIQKMQYVFDSFVLFENCGYDLGEVSYDLVETTGLAMAYSEAALMFDGIMENGETIHFEGRMKIYFALEGGFWEVPFFRIPGFNW